MNRRVKIVLARLLPSRLRNYYHWCQSMIGMVWFGFPSRQLQVIGVTGTDGKSSTTYLTSLFLREAGYRVGMFSSVFYSTGDELTPNNMKITMPNGFFLQRFLRECVTEKCDIVVVEITSEGIKQFRHIGLELDVACITNLHPEHIESHGGFAKYKQAKEQIFHRLAAFKPQSPKTIVYNRDCAEVQSFANFRADRKISFGFSDLANVQGHVVVHTLESTECKVTCEEGACALSMNLGGPFVVPNVLAAIAISRVFAVSIEVYPTVLNRLSDIPGRFSVVCRRPVAIVDYAHTVHAVEQILRFARSHHTGRIIHVFGAAGGGRDRWKRRLLAQASERYTDIQIITEENSFDEPVQDIIAEIVSGFSANAVYETYLTREDAVRRAVEMAGADDLLLFTAKGSEQVIAVSRGQKRPYHEKEFVRLCLSDKFSPDL